jgi:signal peptidase I
MLAGPLILLPLDAARIARRTPPAPRRLFQRWYVLLPVWIIAAFALQGPAIAWIKTHVADAFRIPGSSMVPTIIPGDYVLASSRRPSPAHRGEVVIYRLPGDPRRWTHRIVGIAGDTLAMRGFQLLVNGRSTDAANSWESDSASTGLKDETFAWQRSRLPEGVSAASYRPTYGTWGPLVVQAGEVFVLGDNRPNSADSRFHGPVELENLAGRPEWIYFSRDPTSGAVRWSRLGRATQ